MTAKEILTKIEEAGISASDFGYGDFHLEELGDWQEIDQVGGEGEGDYWHSVKYFKDHDVYIKTIGFYTSYHGTDFHEGYGEEVKPTKKTVIVYE